MAILLATAVLLGTGTESLRAAGGPKRPPIRTPFKPDRIRGNWKEQWGDWTWSAVYRKDGWLEESSADNLLEIGCDIELSCSASFSQSKVQFHMGNVSGATPFERTAHIEGTFTSNNGMFIGLSFAGNSVTPADMVTDTAGNLTGEIRNAMVGTTDTLGSDITSKKFNVKVLLSSDSGQTWNRPMSYGLGVSGANADTLWWSVDGGTAGTHDVEWSVEVLPGIDQADGNYKFTPAVVMAPVL